MIKVTKPWGNYEVLRVEEGFQVKRIEVNPGHRLSYQIHKQRAEKWTITRGRGVATVDNKQIRAEAGHVVDIPIEAKHRIENIGDTPLIFIEVQIGDYLGEDDIVRIEDDYNRETPA